MDRPISQKHKQQTNESRTAIPQEESTLQVKLLTRHSRDVAQEAARAGLDFLVLQLPLSYRSPTSYPNKLLLGSPS